MMRRLWFVVALMALASPASAHALRVFAKEIAGEVTGYGFFIGGGRPKGVDWQAEAAGKTVAKGVTDDQGAFRFAAPLGDVTITLNTGEGHIASTTLGANGSIAAPTAAPAKNPDIAAIEAAVARQILPLQEQITELQNRLRTADIMSGVFLIIGLAGIALWARRRGQ